MTDYYTPTANPVTQTRGTSAQIRAEFELIDTAFDTVNTEMTAKAAAASPTLTGTPLAPTAALGTDTTQIATTAFVQDATSVVRSVRTSNTILAAVDKATLVDITSGTFSQTFTAAATLGSGWWCYIRNSGTGDVTLDPNGAELIDGLASFIMYPGEARLVQSNGTNLFSVVLSGFYKSFLSSGSFVKPPGYTAFQGLLWGGGGNGHASGGGGGGGACLPFTFAASLVSASETVTIGGAATASVFVKTAYPGASATGASGVGGGGLLGAGGAPTGGLPAIAGFGGGAGGATGGASGYGGGGGSDSGAAPGGASIYGGGGGAAAGGVASVSVFGGAGGASGAAGTVPGGGGGGNAPGGAGAAGELRIWGLL